MTQPQFVTRADEFVQGQGLPLREFWGDLQDILPQFGTDIKTVEMPFENVEVIETDPGVVWPHPIAQIECRAFFTRDGRMAAFGAWFEMCQSSVALGYPDIMSLKALRLRLRGTLRPYETKDDCTGPEENLGVEDGQCLVCGKDMDAVEPHKRMARAKEWRVVEVAGAGTETSNNVGEDDLLALFDEPKNASAFAQAVLANVGLRAVYSGPTLYDGTLLAGLLDQGKVVLEGDLYSKVDNLPL